MFESLVANLRRKISKTSDDINFKTDTKNVASKQSVGLKRSLQIFKSKFADETVPQTISFNSYDNNCDNLALSPRAYGTAECAETEVEWTILANNCPNILDKFTKIVTIVEDPQKRHKRNDREEIRKRLAMGVDAEEYYSIGHIPTERPLKKPSLHSRLQNAKWRPSSFPLKATKSKSSHSLGHIELRESDFYALQATLQTEARIALAQAKELARTQMERERRGRAESPVTSMLRASMHKANAPLAPDRRRLSRQLLTDMNIAQLQVIVNSLHGQIEGLNEGLVALLMARDELHMSQDAVLVDIEDLTRYLGVKQEQSKKNKGARSGVRRLASYVHK